MQQRYWLVEDQEEDQKVDMEEDGDYKFVQ